MGQQYCTECGAELPGGVRFCENCGAPVLETQATPAPASTAAAVPPAPAGRFPVAIAAGIVAVLLIAAAAVFFVVPALTGGTSLLGPGPATPTPTVVETSTPIPTTVPPTTPPTPVPDPFPDAYSIGELFYYNEGKYASRATVYRVWMNETYHWHNDLDNRYWTEPPYPRPQLKYLLVFVNIENLGSDGYPYPKSNMIVVHNGGNIYHVDTAHYLPNKASDLKATPIEIQEIEYQPDYFNLEHVEDYGYSHGTTQDFVFPGKGNAIDGYLIYQVPVSLKPEDTYVEIVFDGQDRAVWKLG
jgi:hypothetical protein